MVCMSSALSLPAMRNLACCQTNCARSRVVKYLRAARPRANQNSEAPIIIVLSTSKNAAAVGSAWTARGPVTSAAAAEAAPARCARVSSSAAASGVADERPRRGSRGTGNLPAIDPPPGGGSDDSDPSQAAGAPRFVVPTGQQSPIVASGGAQTWMPIPGDDVLGDCPPPTDTRGGGSVRSVGIGRWPPTVGGVGTVGNGSPLVPGVPVALPGVPPIDGAAGGDTEGSEALSVRGAAVVVPPVVVPRVVVPPVVVPPVAGPPAAGGAAAAGGHAAGTGPSASVPFVAGPPAQSSAVRRAAARPAMPDRSIREWSTSSDADGGTSSRNADSPADCPAAQCSRSSSAPSSRAATARTVNQDAPSVVWSSIVPSVEITSPASVLANSCSSASRVPARFSSVCPRESPARARWVCSVPRLTS